MATRKIMTTPTDDGSVDECDVMFLGEECKDSSTITPSRRRMQNNGRRGTMVGIGTKWEQQLQQLDRNQHNVNVKDRGNQVTRTDTEVETDTRTGNGMPRHFFPVQKTYDWDDEKMEQVEVVIPTEAALRARQRLIRMQRTLAKEKEAAAKNDQEVEFIQEVKCNSSTVMSDGRRRGKRRASPSLLSPNLPPYTKRRATDQILSDDENTRSPKN